MSSNSNQPRSLKVVYTFAAALILLSVTVITGWYTDNQTLLKIHPDFVAMQYNTALGFGFCGLGLWGLGAEKRKLAIFCGIFLLLLGGLTLLEYLFVVDFGIDELLMEQGDQSDVTYPGRMAPNTAFCFTLSGVAVFMVAWQSHFSSQMLTLSVFGALVAGLGFVAFTGYLLDVQAAYGWAQLTAMAVHTAFGFMLMGAGLLSLYALWLARAPEQKNAMIYAILIFIAVITMAFWQALIASDTHGYQSNVWKISVLLVGGILICGLYYYSHKLSIQNSSYGFRRFIAYVIFAFGLSGSMALYSVLQQSLSNRLWYNFETASENRVKYLEFAVESNDKLLESVKTSLAIREQIDETLFNSVAAEVVQEIPEFTSLNWLTNNNSETLDDQSGSFSEPLIKYSFGERINGINNLPDQQFDSWLKQSLNASSYGKKTSGVTTPDNGTINFIVFPIFRSSAGNGLFVEDSSKVNGHLLATFHFDRLMEVVLEKGSNPAGMHMWFEETLPDGRVNQIYQHLSRSGAADVSSYNDVDPEWRWTGKFNFLNREIEVYTIPYDRNAYSLWHTNQVLLPLLFLAFCLIIGWFQLRASAREQKLSELLDYELVLINAIPSPLFVCNASRTITDCNEFFERAMGRPKSEIIGLHRDELSLQFESNDTSVDREDDRLLMLGGKKETNVTVTYADGTPRSVIYMRKSFRSSENRTLGFIGILIDISDQKRIEKQLNEALEHFEILIKSAPDPMIICDDNGVIVQINRETEKLFGYPETDLVGHTIEKLIPAKLRTVHQGYRKSFMREGKSRAMGEGKELLAITRVGESVPVEISLSPITTSRGGLVVTSVRNVSERKKAEKLMNDAKHEAEMASRAKSDFLANMSHEIRTPMNAIIGFCHLALENNIDLKQRSYLKKIEKSADSLLGIINDILDVSKIEAQKLELENIAFDLYGDVLENISNMIGQKSGEKQLELLFNFDADLPSALMGDPLRLGQILLNLLSNAVKFTEEGEISLGINVVEESEKMVRLRFQVTDSGIGLSQEQADKVFQPFSQADTSSTRRYGGTGLGLSITRRLVEMMGGEIKLRSNEGEGTTFEVLLTFEKATLVEPENVVKPENLNVLVVDDNPTSLVILKRYLNSFGYYCDTMQSGKEVLEWMTKNNQSTSYDLVIMDWRMPGIDGIETVRKLQDSKDFAEVPAVIMATAYDKAELVSEAGGIDIKDTLVKPISPSTLLDAIVNVFGSRAFTDKSLSVVENKISFKGVKLLLVEDNETNQELATELLERVEATVKIAGNGEEGIACIKAEKFDLVLMDIQMPVKDGLTATEELRRDPEFASLPIIAMTAHAMVKDKEKSLASGMNDHITKPIDVNQLYQVIQKWLPEEKQTLIKQATASIEGIEPADDYRLQKLNQISGLEPYAAVQRMGGDLVLYQSILSKFANNQGNAVEDIRVSANQLEYETARRQAHTLKGLAGNIGANKVFQLAQDLESGFKNSETHNNLLDELQIEMSHVVSSIKAQTITETVRTQDDVMSQNEYKNALRNLHQLLEDSDTAATDLIESIMLKSPDNYGQLKQIAQHINDYQFSAALESLESVMDLHADEESE